MVRRVASPLGIRPADNAAALGMLLVMLPPVEDLACPLSSEVLLALHGLGLRSLTVYPLVFALSTLVPAALVAAAPVPAALVMSLHGFRHYMDSGENHDSMRGRRALAITLAA